MNKFEQASSDHHQMSLAGGWICSEGVGMSGRGWVCLEGVGVSRWGMYDGWIYP